MKRLCEIFCLLLLINGCVQVSNSRCSTGFNDASRMVEIVKVDTSKEDVKTEH